MKTLFQKPMRWLFLLALALCLSGCAIGQDKKVEHGFDVQNLGTAWISAVVIHHGNVTYEDCKRSCAKGGGSFYGVYMPIQPEMQVSWKTADGQQHQATVPVRVKVKDLQRFARLFLEFNGDQLIVQQGSFFSNPGLVGWDKAPLYP